jgi:Protein of unknown function (DUF3703)
VNGMSPTALEQASVHRELLRSARAHELEGHAPEAWEALEAAHILGQQRTGQHVRAHIAMLGLAWRTGDRREIFGQLSRVLGAALSTWLWVPVGNTGRANVSAFKPMPIPPAVMGRIRELTQIASDHKERRDLSGP